MWITVNGEHGIFHQIAEGRAFDKFDDRLKKEQLLGSDIVAFSHNTVAKRYDELNGSGKEWICTIRALVSEDAKRGLDQIKEVVGNR